MHKRRGLFFQSLLLTLLVVLPMMGGVVYFAARRGERQAAEAAAAGTTLAEPAGARSTHRLLLAVQGEEPAFLLLRLDGPAQQALFCALPGEMQLQAPAGTTTLAACYLTAGPARAAKLLGDTLGIAPDAYLAATAAGFADLWGDGPAIRFDTAAVLEEAVRAELGYGQDSLAELDAAAAPEFLQAAARAGLPPPALAQARAAVWAAYFRQGQPNLAALPDAVRAASARLLTDLTAQDLARLEETLTWLSGAAGFTADYVAAGTEPAAGGWQLTADGRDTLLELLAGGAPATPETAGG
ncbi:MAG TPA: hypothetical protein H9709_03645 [Candidatus Gemmiger stercoripullorum]|nr:hypothetical protein [Candidatus Gemmiger stercoripullorum]